MKILEMQLKLEPMTLLEVKKKCRVVIMDEMLTLDTTVNDYFSMFDVVIEI